MPAQKTKYIFILIGLLLSIGILGFSWMFISSFEENAASKPAIERNHLAELNLMGKSKDYLRQTLGEPDEIEELVRSEQHVFGPIEDLWYKIEMGEKIVTWKYATGDGRKELYFLNDTNEVAGEFYWYNELEKNPVF